MLAEKSVQIGAIDPGFARGFGDVAAVQLDERLEVAPLEFVERAPPRLVIAEVRVDSGLRECRLAGDIGQRHGRREDEAAL